MGRNLGPLNIKDSYEGLVQISGSDQLTDGSGSLISSLDVTASYATNAGTSGYAGTAGFATSASFATTASFALNVTPIDTGSLMVTGSATDATLTFTKGDGSTFDLVVDNVVNATNAVSASIANSATTALLATTASHALQADSASIADVSTLATTLNNDVSTNYDLTFVDGNGEKPLYVAQKGNLLVNPNTGNLQVTSITASIGQFDNLTATSASIGYLQTITGSAKIIGDAYIILNNNLPTERYAGLVVQDSGSGSPLTTSSLQYDGQTDDWFYEYSTDGGVTTDHGVAMFGPEYSVKGVPTYLSNNTIPKGDGGHHLNDSNITDDGTLVTIDSNVSASGYVSASSFIGDGSQLTGISSDPFPYTGSAEITGSLDVIGPLTSGDGTNTVGTNGNEVAIGGNNNNVTGNRSAAIGGYTNSVTGGSSVMIGGRANTLSGAWSVIGGGQGVQATGYTSAVIGSETSNATNSYAFIAGAVSGNASGQYSVIVGGQSHNVSGERSGIFAGHDSTISGIRSATIGGTTPSVTHNRSVVLGGTSLASSKDEEVVVPSLSIYGDTLVDDGTNTGTLLNNVGQSAVSSEDAVNTVIHLTQAEYDALTPDANTLYVIDGAETLGDTTIDGQLIGTVNTISNSGGTVALDCSVGNYFTLAMPSGGTTELVPTNITAGQTINIEITQNSTASTLTYDNTIEFPGGTAFTISTGAGAVDVLTLVSFDGVNLKATGLANFS